MLKGTCLPDFGKLDGLKERLKIFPVADMVKSLVIELDLFNRCQQWGKAAQRQRNLQAIIEDAKDFDINAATLGEASSVEHYLDHLDNENEGVTVKEGFFQEGVKVMTYHGSKGLQWNIVILCSLDNDPMNVRTVKKRFVFGVIYVRMSVPSAGHLYSSYYLTCLPTFLPYSQSNLSDDMENVLDTLTPYVQYVDRVRYEARRLLYVGVTRARDYLITTSLKGGAKSTADKLVPWLTSSGIQSQLNTTGDFRAVWGGGTNVSESRFVEVVDDGTYESPTGPTAWRCRKESSGPTVREAKYLSPSKMEDKVLQESVQPRVIYPVQDEQPSSICVGQGDEYDIMGTCIHNIFAVYCPEAGRAAMRGKAQRIVGAYKMDKMLPNVDSILDSADALYRFLEKHYGKAVRIGHEVPFRNGQGGQVVTGEMDLLWFTAPKECVLIDFKNYPGIIGNVLKRDQKEYVGKHAVQLKAYEEALLAAGVSVKDKLIYYSVLGCLISL